MVNVLTEILIEKPIKTVSGFASDPENAPRWYVNIKSAKRLGNSSELLKVGSLAEFKAEFLGKSLAYTYKVVELTPTRLVMRTEQGPFPMETTYEWTKVDENRTKMSLRNVGSPKGFSKLFTPFMSMAMRRANQKDLLKLKKILENQ
jgi:hypothetical protein